MSEPPSANSRKMDHLAELPRADCTEARGRSGISSGMNAKVAPKHAKEQGFFAKDRGQTEKVGGQQAKMY
jgi:hypothetical protein